MRRGDVCPRRGVTSDAERAGRVTTFAAIWEAHAAELERRCRGWMGERDLGDEAFGRTAAQALEKFSRHDGSIINVRAWLLSLAHNVCMDFHRERRRDRGELLESVEPRRLVAHGDPEQEILGREMHVLLQWAVSELPHRLRVPLELVLYEHLSYRDVAQLLDVSEPGLRKRMQQARVKLRDRLRAYDRGRRPRKESSPPARAVKKTLRDLHAVTIARPDGSKIDRELLLAEPPADLSDAEARRLRQYVAKHPTGWRMRLRLARALLARGITHAAVAEYRAVLDRRPDRDTVALELYEVLHARGQGSEGERLREQAAGSISSRDRLIEAAREALVSGDLLRAARVAEPMARSGDRAAMILLYDSLREAGLVMRAHEWIVLANEPARLASDLVERGHLEVAGQLIGQIHPALAIRSELEARMFVAQGNPARAEEVMREFTKREPGHVDGWLAAARIAAAAGSTGAVVDHLSHALALDQTSTTLIEAAAISAGASMFDAAWRLVEDIEPSWRMLALACRIQTQRGIDPLPARTLASQLLTHGSLLALSWLRAGAVLHAAKLHDEAIAALARGSTLLPENDAHEVAAEIATQIASCCEAMGDAESAMTWLAIARARRRAFFSTTPAG